MEDEEEDGIYFEFELLNSCDGKIVTLVCSTEEPLSTSDFAEALRAFADRVETIETMSEASGYSLN